MSGASLFVAGAAFGNVAVSLFVAGAAFGDVAVSLFVAGAASGEIWVDSRSARLRDVIIFNRKGVSEARKVTSFCMAGAALLKLQGDSAGEVLCKYGVVLE